MKHWQMLIAICIGCLIGATFAANTKANDTNSTEQPADFSTLQIFTYNSGLTGFFEPKTAKLYIYDSNLEKCFIIRELKKLGEPMQRLQN